MDVEDNFHLVLTLSIVRCFPFNISGGIFRAEKHTGANQQIMTRGLPKRPMDIHVYAGGRQEQCELV